MYVHTYVFACKEVGILTRILTVFTHVCEHSVLFQDSSSVISRVAGFTCLHVLRGHSGCVQALTAVEGWTDGHTYLVSGRDSTSNRSWSWRWACAKMTMVNVQYIHVHIYVHACTLYHQCTSVHIHVQISGGWDLAVCVWDLSTGR